MCRRHRLLLALLLLLPACSSAAEVPPTTATADAAAEPSARTAAPGTDGDGTRTVVHELGTAEVPSSPQRVVVLDGDVTLEPVVALGVEVAAATSPNVIGAFSEAVATRLPADFTDLGPQAELDIEAVAAAQPDLILINPAVGDLAAIHDELSRIAPTVGPAFHQVDWRDRLVAIGEVFGLADRASGLLQEFDARTAEVAEALPDDLATLTMARVRGDGFRYLTRDGAFPWTVLAPLGFAQPQGQQTGDRDTPFVNLSPEEADLLDAEVIVLAVDGEGIAGEGEDTLAELDDNPLFAALSGRRLVVPSASWVFGSILSAHAILDDVEAQLGA